MMRARSPWLVQLALTVAVISVAARAESPSHGRLSVAVTDPNVEPIVMAVGGNQVDTFSLFRGCILRKGLDVEAPVEARLKKADVIVWSGFLAESAAIQASLKRQSDKATSTEKPLWIDVSRGATRVNVPVSPCYGAVDAGFVTGDPFFWLNPSNGAIIARNVARSLGSLQPDKRKYYAANADAFARALDADIARWKQQLKPLAKLRVFTTQCGWQNFSRMGGPVFIVCKETPGSLPSPKLLVERITQAKAQIVLLDPNTPPEYGMAFREQPELRVVDMASSVEGKPSPKSYNELFDNLVRTLLAAADAPKQAAGN